MKIVEGSAEGQQQNGSSQGLLRLPVAGLRDFDFDFARHLVLHLDLHHLPQLDCGVTPAPVFSPGPMTTVWRGFRAGVAVKGPGAWAWTGQRPSRVRTALIPVVRGDQRR